MQPFTKTHINFNSHAHVERDMCGTNFGGGAKISTHTLTWSVTSICLTPPLEYVFQLTRSHVERDHFLKKIGQVLKYFNSHAHVERDFVKIFLEAVNIISTHTLTWSVTNNCPTHLLQV